MREILYKNTSNCILKFYIVLKNNLSTRLQPTPGNIRIYVTDLFIFGFCIDSIEVGFHSIFLTSIDDEQLTQHNIPFKVFAVNVRKIKYSCRLIQ